jgi:hypothetical protein
VITDEVVEFPSVIVEFAVLSACTSPTKSSTVASGSPGDDGAITDALEPAVKSAASALEKRLARFKSRSTACGEVALTANVLGNVSVVV